MDLPQPGVNQTPYIYLAGLTGLTLEIRDGLDLRSLSATDAELAAKYGIENPPAPSPGCALTMEGFAKKVKDVFDHHPDYQRWEFEILKIGRHFRLEG